MMEEQESKEIPKYKCHKEVQALKITGVDGPDIPSPDGKKYYHNLEVEPVSFSPLTVSVEYMQRHGPQPGGYYVLYEDGYTSYSPAKAFEEGYTKL